MDLGYPFMRGALKCLEGKKGCGFPPISPPSRLSPTGLRPDKLLQPLALLVPYGLPLSPALVNRVPLLLLAFLGHQISHFGPFGNAGPLFLVRVHSLFHGMGSRGIIHF